VVVVEISWVEWESRKLAKEWATQDAAKLTKLWWHLNLGYWFWSQSLLDRFYTALERLLLLLVLIPCGGAMWLTRTVARPEPTDELNEAMFALHVLIEQPALLLCLSVLIAWLLTANIVVCCSDRTYRQSGKVSAVVLRILCRWVWPHFLGGS
jgi:hypothetical protein